MSDNVREILSVDKVFAIIEFDKPPDEKIDYCGKQYTINSEILFDIAKERVIVNDTSYGITYFIYGMEIVKRLCFEMRTNLETIDDLADVLSDIKVYTHAKDFPAIFVYGRYGVSIAPRITIQ